MKISVTFDLIVDVEGWAKISNISTDDAEATTIAGLVNAGGKEGRPDGPGLRPDLRHAGMRHGHGGEAVVLSRQGTSSWALPAPCGQPPQ